MDLTSYLLGKNASGSGGGGGGGGADLSDYFVTEIESNTSDVSNLGIDLIKKTPPIEVGTNVTNLSYCFYNYPLKKLDVSRMNTSNVTNMSYMFYGCANLEDLDVSNFDLSSVTTVQNMFTNSGLKKLDLSNFTFNPDITVAVRNFVSGTSKLAILDISNLEFTKISSTLGVFQGCGTSCLQSDGAYADGIPYVYVKNETAQTWVLNSQGHPSSWTTDNVIIKQ